MSSTTMSINHTHFWLCTVGLLLVWIVVISTALPRDNKSPSPIKYWGKNQAQEQRLENNCKSLCEQCGCIGFYCGEQCLCEYNKLASSQPDKVSYRRLNDTKTTRSRHSDGECIASMQDEANFKNLPYEVLIQGPTSDRFIRTAIQLAQDTTHTAGSVQVGQTPQKRSTISIYRPYAPLKNNNELVEGNDNRKTLKDAITRMRRSTDHLDWFSDFASTLVRPAPRRKAQVSASSGNKKREAQRTKKEEGVSRERPESWFSDHPNLLLRPAPLFRRRASQQPQQQKKSVKHEETEYENESRDSQEDAPLAPMRKALKNTIRNIQESELGENIRESLRTGLRDSGDLLQSTLDSGNLEVLPKRFRDDFVEVFDSWLKSQQQTTESSLQMPVVPARSAPSNIMLPWLRPVRFLQRVQQALN